MTDLRKRRPEGTLQRRVFLALRRCSANADLIAQLVGAPRETCRKACDYMKSRGIVTAHRYGHRLTIYAVKPRTHPPKDLRGKRPASRNHRGAPAFAKWLLMMKAKHGPGWRYKPSNPHALESALNSIGRRQ